MDYWVQKRIDNIASAFTPEYCRAIDRAIALLVEQFSAGHAVLICGNGGSAADAQHIAAELVGRFQMHRKGLPAIALGTNPATLTAWSNDCEFETIFSRQVESLGKPGDILWGISTSGKSPNVLHALKTAKENGLKTIGMAGNCGGLLTEFADYPLFVEQKQTACIQEVHLITYHRMCEQIESRLFGTSWKDQLVQTTAILG
ncbi:D-sedoheptulose 7-phosphate isomerase [Lusitaniella coriacea LEGE 07157]|uniref:D-sedoheptulose-7-phosphate isomerase n=1 Tax=Lusitaniella coriacea LEGE 07157 TaxID=945747 RepID=A0A8J7E2K4_9CYAN|nr:D-sedoheptulose 7-phosphate isomerase [Lusitaniella coriacea]MBE9117644.1 D-sedoheptulose 7-phosphate isomerase [Lusitaniella coriacea LEGE 07157]